MEETDLHFDVQTIIEEELIQLVSSGNYSLSKANNLFKLAIDHCLLHQKTKVLIDVSNVTGSIPFLDRFKYAEYLADYRADHAMKKIIRVAVIGQEPIVHKDKFGETVAVNRGANVRVFTNMSEASMWLSNT